MLSSNRKTSFDALANKLENHIEAIILLLRNDITSGNRLNLRTLLILLIQAQNILNRLIEKNANSPDDFDWLGQMRYYFNENKIEIKMLLSKLLYGFEYIGNKSRMVITPLTDRCYRAVFVALNQHFGMALQVCDCLCVCVCPFQHIQYEIDLIVKYSLFFVGLKQGEAGVGKTEIIKDLAKSMATYCISFNCAHDLDYIVMSKFFKGVAACGAW